MRFNSTPKIQEGCSKMSREVISLAAIARTLRTTGGQDDASKKFKDQSIVDMTLVVLDFHYEDAFGEDGKPRRAEEFMLEDMYEVMAKAEDVGKSKIEAVREWLEETISANADDIESAIAAAASH